MTKYLFFSINRYGVIKFFLIVLLLSSVGCSHKKPYYRTEELKPDKISVIANEIVTRIILIGDCGEPQENEPVLKSLQNWSSLIPEKTTVFFLGDNIYPAGLPAEDDPWRSEGERRLLAQLDAVKNSGADVVFTPGNHDWAHGKSEGLFNLRQQENFVVEYFSDKQSFQPSNGCPGPVAVDVERVRVIIFDSQWWFHKYEKPTTECPQSSTAEIISEIHRLINETPEDKEIIVLAHHPLANHGPHGGFYSWKDHIFPLTSLVNWMYLPLPIIGSLYPLGRWNLVKSNQDMNGPLYKDMIARLDSVLSQNPPMIYAAGHDHNLQVLDGGSSADLILVSGAGVQKKLNDVGDGDDTLFAHSHTGFMTVDFFRDGRILLQVIEPPHEEVVFQMWLDK